MSSQEVIVNIITDIDDEASIVVNQTDGIITSSQSNLNVVTDIDDEASIVVDQINGVITSFQSDLNVIKAVEIGPQGPPGSTQQGCSRYVAGENISGHRVVCLKGDGKVYYADYSDAEEVLCVVGITTGAALADDFVVVRFSEMMEEPSWNWEIGKLIFLGENGLLTQVPPSSGYVLRVAYPLSEKAICVSISEIIAI